MRYDDNDRESQNVEDRRNESGGSPFGRGGMPFPIPMGTGRGGISPDPDALADVPTADAELVDVEEERVLLAGFRNLPRRSQQLVLDLVETLQSGKRRSGKV